MIDFTKLKVCMDEILRDTNTPSVDCIVYQDHKQLYRYFAGMRDVENDLPTDGNEQYLIFSMTKMLTCTAALQMLEQGKYSLDDKLSEYIPAFGRMKVTTAALNTQNAEKITTGAGFGENEAVTGDGYAHNPIRIVDLFTMQAGLDYNLQDAAIKQAISEGKTGTVDIVTAMSEKVLAFEPGTRFRYSLCHDVLGALVEIWSGEKLGEYMKRHIFDPLGMKRTRFCLQHDEETYPQMAARYTCDEAGNLVRSPFGCAYNFSDDYQSGGAGLMSCTEDYALFLDAVACGGVGKSGNRILKEETIALWKTNQLKDQSLEDFHVLRPGYGYGLGVRTHMEPSVSGSMSPIGEFGWDGAAGSFAMVDTERKLSFTYFQHCHKWDKAIQTKMRNALYTCVNE